MKSFQFSVVLSSRLGVNGNELVKSNSQAGRAGGLLGGHSLLENDDHCPKVRAPSNEDATKNVQKKLRYISREPKLLDVETGIR
jgi:hypothetical protein